MNLKDLFSRGQPLIGSPLDATLKSLGEMGIASQVRHGYADPDGNWTDKGYDRATTRDYAALDAGLKARSALEKRLKG